MVKDLRIIKTRKSRSTISRRVSKTSSSPLRRPRAESPCSRIPPSRDYWQPHGNRVQTRRMPSDHSTTSHNFDSTPRRTIPKNPSRSSTTLLFMRLDESIPTPCSTSSTTDKEAISNTWPPSRSRTRVGDFTSNIKPGSNAMKNPRRSRKSLNRGRIDSSTMRAPGELAAREMMLVACC